MTQLIQRISAGVLAASLLLACGQPDRRAGTSAPPAVASASANVQPSAAPLNAPAPAAAQASASADAVTVSAVVAPSLADSVAQADLIMIGQISEIGDVINTQRDTEDTTKPASDSFGIGQVYQFKVERYLKGQGPALVPLVQDEGAIEKPPTAITQADLAHARAVYGVPPMVQGTRYVILVSPDTILDRTITYYHGNAYPWRYTLHDDGSVEMPMPADAGRVLSRSFAPDDENALLARIEQLVKDGASVTPVR